MNDDFFTNDDTRPVSTIDDRLRGLVSQLISGELDFDSAMTLFSGDFQELFTDWLKDAMAGDKEYLTWSPAKQTYMQLDRACAIVIGHICTIRNEDAPLLKDPTRGGNTIAEHLRSLVIRSYNNDVKIELAQEMFAICVSQIYEAFTRGVSILGLIENGYNFEVALVAIQDAIYLVFDELSKLSTREAENVEGERMPWNNVEARGELSGPSDLDGHGVPLQDDDDPA